MDKKSQKMSIIVPFALYRKIKKTSDAKSEKEEEFVSMNTVILEILKAAYDED